jgi:hypothetical protein
VLNAKTAVQGIDVPYLYRGGGEAKVGAADFGQRPLSYHALGGTHATPRKSAKTRLSSRGNIKLAPPKSGNGTNAKVGSERLTLFCPRL